MVFNKQLPLRFPVHLISGCSFFVNNPEQLFPLLHKECFQSHEPLRSQVPSEAMFVLSARRNEHVPKKKRKLNNGSWVRKNKDKYLRNAIRNLISLSCYSRIIKEYARVYHALTGLSFFKLNLPANCSFQVEPRNSR